LRREQILANAASRFEALLEHQFEAQRETKDLRGTANIRSRVFKRMIPGTLQRRLGHTGDRKGGFFSPLDARKRIALARNVERQSRTHLLEAGSRKARR
jgi:hypothetical protein